MISVIITSFKEPKTIGRAIEAALNQTYRGAYEIIVSAPDTETLAIAKTYSKNNSNIKIVQDSGEGKPLALNGAVKKAKGDILVLTDGDVFMSLNALETLSTKLANASIGAVSARVISADSHETMFGFWAYLLTETFHSLRLQEEKSNKLIVCSGYLYAVRKKLFKPLPQDILADDAFVSYSINAQGNRTAYAPCAEVYVRYPSNLKDWIKQKKRTAGRYYQLQNYFTISKVKDFAGELRAALSIISKLNSPKRVSWFLFLIVMRLYIWFRIAFDFRLWKREFSKAWERVESTK